MKPTIIAIDGPAGAGKSTTSKLVASKLGLRHVDTGATYRLAALLALQAGIPLDDPARLSDFAAGMLAGCDLDDGQLVYRGQPVGDEIRTPEVSHAASVIAAHPEVRRVLVDLQRSLVGPEGAVVEGRDIGTVVWPQATVKVYLDAAPEVRAQRRDSEGGHERDALDAVRERDLRDASRPVGSMRPAPDALVFDTSTLTPEEVAARVLALVATRRPVPGPGPLYRFIRVILRGLLSGPFRMNIHGKENIPRVGGAILAMNHRSLIDIPVAALTTKRQVFFMAKEELFRSKIGASLVRRLGGFPVRRGRPDRSALLRSLELLEAGAIVGIFPEGTRRPDASFQEIEEGFAYIALKSGAPIIPVAISGTESVFPPGKRLPRFVKVRVRIGPAFSLGEPHAGVLPRSKIRAASDEAGERLAETMAELEPGR